MTNQQPAPSLLKKAKQQFSKFRKTILRELTRCKETGKMIAIHSLALSERPVLSSVEDIYQSGNDEVVVVKWFDAESHIASQTHVFLDEILSISPADKQKRSAIY